MRCHWVELSSYCPIPVTSTTLYLLTLTNNLNLQDELSSFVDSA